MVDATLGLRIWRHPKPIGAAGRCIGRTDLPVDPRRTKRLAHRIRQHARRHRLPHAVVTSPLRRCADVGRWLRRWGWTHRVDARLVELDFGDWDGRLWRDIAWDEIRAWEDDFLDHAPGGGESLRRLRGRVEAMLARDRPVLAVGHAGWINALRTREAATLGAADWPVPLRYGQWLAVVSTQSGNQTMRPRDAALSK
jgi:alpha-ribazole phosphatase